MFAAYGSITIAVGGPIGSRWKCEGLAYSAGLFEALPKKKKSRKLSQSRKIIFPFIRILLVPRLSRTERRSEILVLSLGFFSLPVSRESLNINSIFTAIW